MESGIYCITNTINGKMYIGQSLDVKNRLYDHKSDLRKNAHHNQHLQNSFNKYGEDAFNFGSLKRCKPKYLDRFEKLYIRVFDLMNREKGYNKESGGSSNKTISDETREKLSQSKQKEKNPMYEIGENHPNFGKHRSESTKKKISESLKGNHLSEETCMKLSDLKNTTGFFRVYQQPCPTCKQGFRWVYSYYDGDKRKRIASVSIEKLEDKVKAEKLIWKELV